MVKTPDEILRDMAERNHVDLRMQRQNALNALGLRVTLWLNALSGRGHGPTGTERDAIASDLDEHLERFRHHE